MQAIRSPDIGHYADALIELGRATDSLLQIEQDMTVVLDLLESNEKLRHFMADPLVKEEGKARSLQEILEGRISSVLLQYLLILHGQGRIHDLGDVAELFFDKAGDLHKKEAGEVLSSVPLSPETIAAIEDETGRIIGKSVHLRTRTDPNMLGGVYVRVGDFVIDGTIDTQLEELRQQLLHG